MGLIRAVMRRKFVLSPIRFVDLESRGRAETWHATGPLPKIELGVAGRRFPTGWVVLSLGVTVHAADSAFGEILVDTGRGFGTTPPVRVPRNIKGACFVRFPDTVTGLEYRPIKGAGSFSLQLIAAREVCWLEVVVRQLLHYCQAEGLTPWRALRAALVHMRVFGIGDLWTWIRQYARGEHPDRFYGPWAARREQLLLQTSNDLRRRAQGLAYRPKLSVLMPVYRTPERWLRKAIESVLGQLYDNWELCICDDHSESRAIESLLEEYRQKDVRIKIVRRSSNGHIAVATNDALQLATGEFICLLDHDDALSPDALLEFAFALNEDRSIDLLYSDEDYISIEDVRYEPIIKPAWSPENLESYMYIGHFICCRTDAARQIGGFRPELTGAQDFDFMLRYTERFPRVRHVPKVLYHWRAVPGSVAVSIDRKQYVVALAKRALEDRLEREGARGTVRIGGAPGWFETRRELVGQPKVSVIVYRSGTTSPAPSRRDVEACCESLKASTYQDVEVFVAGDEGNPAEALNEAARQAGGDYLVFMSAAVRVNSPNWLEEMLMHNERPGVGVTGPKLLFADGTVRHGGIVFDDGMPRSVRLGYPRLDWGYWGNSAIPRNYLAVAGACMMVRAATFRRAGGFDPEMSPTYHHLDLCLRIVSSGERVVYVPAVELYDYGHLPIADRQIALAFQRRWKALTCPDPYYGANLSLDPPTFDFEGEGIRR